MNNHLNLIFKIVIIFVVISFDLNAQSNSVNDFNPNELSQEKLQKFISQSFIIHSFQVGGPENEGEAQFGCFSPNEDNLFSQDAVTILDHYVKSKNFSKPIFFVSVGFGFRESPASLAKLEPYQMSLRENKKWLASDTKLASQLCQLAEEKGITIWISRGDGSWEKSTELVAQLKDKN